MQSCRVSRCDQIVSGVRNWDKASLEDEGFIFTTIAIPISCIIS